MMKRIVFFVLLLLCVCCSVVKAADGETYVVVAGVSDYKTVSDLVLPEKDAKTIAQLYQAQTKNVILLTGKYATKKRIVSSLKQQFARAKENDRIVFFFSGHGYPGGICPYDMTADKQSGITYKEILKILKSSRAKQKIIFADACFSGGLRTNGNYSIEHSVKDTDVLFFLSSRTGETSIENPFMVNGFFTTYLARGLRGGADIDRNRIITARELFQFVSEKVLAKSKNRQHPVMWGQFDDDYAVMEW